MTKEAGVDATSVYSMVCVGNTTMEHLFLGVDPINIGLHPYTPVFQSGWDVKASDIGFRLHPRAQVYVFPSVSGFVGGDTVAVILSTQLGKFTDDMVRIAVDIGTNGEIAVAHKERVMCASCAAGPAFEGARISRGMWAQRGAVERVLLSGNGGIKLGVIGGGPARGFCGSGVIDAVSELVRVGLVDRSGRIQAGEDVSAVWATIVQEDSDGRVCVLADGKETEDGAPLAITQRDIRELQLAKSAVVTGISIVLKRLGVTPSQVGEVYLAGAFGSYIDPKSAVGVGLLPPLEKARLVGVGNAAQTGALRALVSREDRREVDRIGAETEYAELATDQEFQCALVEGMGFPTAKA